MKRPDLGKRQQAILDRYGAVMAQASETFRGLAASLIAVDELMTELKAVEPLLVAVLHDEPAAPEPAAGPGRGRQPVVDFGPTRYCEACGKELVRKRSTKTGLLEPGPQFLARRFCDQQCHGTFRRTVAAINVKTCLECGNEFTRPANEGHAKFGTRKFCGHACASRARYRAAPLQPGSKPKTPRAKVSEPRPAPRPKPQPPRPVPDKRKPPRVPQTPIKASAYDARSKPIPVVPGSIVIQQPSEAVRMEVLGEPCPHHPTEKVNAWGKCPACVAGAKWAERERATVIRPHPDGGR